MDNNLSWLIVLSTLKTTETSCLILMCELKWMSSRTSDCLYFLHFLQLPSCICNLCPPLLSCSLQLQWKGTWTCWCSPESVSNQYFDLKIQQGTQTLTTCLMQWAALWACSIVEKHLYSVLWRESSVQDEIQHLQIITIIWTFVSKEREIYHLRILQVLTECQM